MITTLLFLISLIPAILHFPIPVSGEERAAKRVNKKVIQDFKAKYQMECGATQIGTPNDRVDFMKLYMELKRPLNQDEARRLILETSKQYLEAINSDKRIRPYLSSYPFEFKNIGVDILTYDQNGKSFHSPFVGVVFSDNKKIIYQKRIPKGEFDYEVITEIETFEEAEQKLKNTF